MSTLQVSTSAQLHGITSIPHRGPERWLSSKESWLLFQKIGIRFPASTWWVTTIYNSCPPKDSGALFWPLRVLHALGAGTIHAGEAPPVCIKTNCAKKLYLFFHRKGGTTNLDSFQKYSRKLKRMGFPR